MRSIVLVRGLGDVASAVAHRLLGEGYGVILFDELRPPATRRRMAFTDAAFDDPTVSDRPLALTS